MNNFFNILRKNYNHVLNNAKRALDTWKVSQYLHNGCKPWSTGYNQYKEKYIINILNDENILNLFNSSTELPENFGYRLDERVVEYPWLFSRLDPKQTHLLDAGSALNIEFLLRSRWLRDKSVVIYNLSPERIVLKNNISYIYGDLRNTILKDECFEECVCISTIEHVGMNNKMLYSTEGRYDEYAPDSYVRVIQEYNRLLKPGGRLYLTVPYGKYQNLGWLQQFDKTSLATLIESFDGHLVSASYFKYYNDGWHISDAESCSDCLYFDIHSRTSFEIDYLAAARSVACIELVK